MKVAYCTLPILSMTSVVTTPSCFNLDLVSRGFLMSKILQTSFKLNQASEFLCTVLTSLSWKSNTFISFIYFISFSFLVINSSIAICANRVRGMCVLLDNAFNRSMMSRSEERRVGKEGEDWWWSNE